MEEKEDGGEMKVEGEWKRKLNKWKGEGKK